MDWDEFLQWSQKGFIAACALVVMLILSLAVREEARHHRHRAEVRPPVAAHDHLAQ
jgi:hypothetical protein